jgi:hypothetical protein
MRLNLGCGDDVKEGYVNVDFRQTHPSVMQVDLSKFPWPFEDASSEEILMLDFLEHFPYAQTKSILLECFRILRADGTVVIQVPDATHLMRALTKDGDYLCNSCGGGMWIPADGPDTMDDNRGKCPRCGQHADSIAEAAMKRLFGGQDFVGNFHQTCFTEDSLVLKAKECGLELKRFEEQAHQWKNWNFKARFKKGEIW